MTFPVVGCLAPGQLQLSIPIDSFVDSFAGRLCEALGDALRHASYPEYGRNETIHLTLAFRAQLRPILGPQLATGGQRLLVAAILIALAVGALVFHH